jgi:hypothetical protein
MSALRVEWRIVGPMCQAERCSPNKRRVLKGLCTQQRVSSRAMRAKQKTSAERIMCLTEGTAMCEARAMRAKTQDGC